MKMKSLILTVFATLLITTTGHANVMLPAKQGKEFMDNGHYNAANELHSCTFKKKKDRV